MDCLSMYDEICWCVVRIIWRGVKCIFAKLSNCCFGFMGYNTYKNAAISVSHEFIEFVLPVSAEDLVVQLKI